MNENNNLITIKISDLKKNEINSFSLSENKKAGIFFVDDEIKVYNLTCPHMGADLSKGTIDKKDQTIQCPWHGYCYNLEDGTFNRNPNIEFTMKARKKSRHYDPDFKVPCRLGTIRFTINKDLITIFR